MLSFFWSIFKRQPKTALQLLSKLMGAVCVYDTQGQLLYSSPKFSALVPIPAEPIGFSDIAIESGTPKLLEHHWQQALQGEPVWFLAKGRNASSVECCLQLDPTAELLLLTAQPARSFPYLRQLTEAYERLILKLFNHPNFATALVDRNGAVIQCNAKLYELLGVEGELVNLEDFIHPEDRHLDETLRQDLLAGKIEAYTLERRFIDQNNEVIWLNTNTSLINLPFSYTEHPYFVVLLEDITENRKMYSALVRTEEKWKTLVLNSLHLFLQTSSTGQIIYASPAVEQILGYREEELLDFYISDLAHPEDLNEFELALHHWSNGTQYGDRSIECRWRSRSGQWVSLCIQGQRFPLALEIDGMVISGYNITDRKFLESKLQASEEKFRSLLLNLPGAVFRCDLTYTPEFMSDEVQGITGYRAVEFIGNRIRSYLSIVHPEDVDLIRNSVTELTLNRRPCSIEYRITHANGAMRWVSEYRQGVFDETGRLLWLDGILFNVSDRKETETDLHRSSASRPMLRVLPSLAAHETP